MPFVERSQFDLETDASYLGRMVFEESGPYCFYCAKYIYEGSMEGTDGDRSHPPMRRIKNVVYWDGPTKPDGEGVLNVYILLHAECAKQLGMHLICDGLAAEKAIADEVEYYKALDRKLRDEDPERYQQRLEARAKRQLGENKGTGDKH